MDACDCKIALIMDDAGVREQTARRLTERGFVMAPTVHDQEALTVLMDGPFPEGVRVVVIEVKLWGRRNGPAILEKLMLKVPDDERAGMLFIIFSGYSESDIVDDLDRLRELAPDVHYVAKSAEVELLDNAIAGWVELQTADYLPGPNW